MKTSRPGSQGVIFWTQRGKCENAWQAKCRGQSGKWGHFMFAIVSSLTSPSRFVYMRIRVFVYVCICVYLHVFDLGSLYARNSVSVCPSITFQAGFERIFWKVPQLEKLLNKTFSSRKIFYFLKDVLRYMDIHFQQVAAKYFLLHQYFLRNGDCFD